MLDTPCSEVVWRVLATYCIRQFPLHFPSCASPCAITFQLESTTGTRGHLKCDGTRALTRFRLSAKRTIPCKLAGGRQFSLLLAAEVCASTVVMFRGSVKSTGYPLHSLVSPSLPLRTSPFAITYQLESTPPAVNFNIWVAFLACLSFSNDYV